MPKRAGYKKPIKDDVYGKLAAAKSYWGMRVTEQERDYLYYTLQQPVGVPEGFDVVYPPTGNTTITTLADHVSADIPQVEVPQANQSQKAELRSERVEKGLQAAIRKWLREASSNQVRTGVINMGWAGMAVSQGPIFDPKAWGEEPLREDFQTQDEFTEAKQEYEAVQRTVWPFWWRMIDPRYAFPDPGTVGKEWVILSFQRTVGSIKAQWPSFKGKIPKDSGDDRGGSSTSTTIAGQLGGGTTVGAYGGGSGYYLDTDYVEWIEYWDKGWRMYLAAGEVIDVSEHRYTKPPFQIRSAGLGNESSLPHEQFRSVLYPARSLLDQEISAMSQFASMMRQTAWQQLVTPLGSLFDKIIPGTVKQLRREDIELTKNITTIEPGIVASLAQEIDIIQAGIEDATFPRVVKGQAAPGLRSGYGQNSLVAQARIRFGTVASSMESLLEEFFADLLRCVELVVEEKVPVWGPTRTGLVDSVLDPADINGYYYVKVTLNPKLPSDRANEIAIGQQLLAMEAIDMDTFRQDFAGFQQPQELRVRVMRDKILNSPGMQEFLRLATLDELGITDWVMSNAQKLGIDPAIALQALGIMNTGGPGGPNAQGTPPAGAQPPGAGQSGGPSAGDILAQPNSPGPGLSQGEVARAAGAGSVAPPSVLNR